MRMTIRERMGGGIHTRFLLPIGGRSKFEVEYRDVLDVRQCTECKGDIVPGEKCYCARGWFDGIWAQHYVCIPCEELRGDFDLDTEALNGPGITRFGKLEETLMARGDEGHLRRWLDILKRVRPDLVSDELLARLGETL